MPLSGSCIPRSLRGSTAWTRIRENARHNRLNAFAPPTRGSASEAASIGGFKPETFESKPLRLRSNQYLSFPVENAHCSLTTEKSSAPRAVISKA